MLSENISTMKKGRLMVLDVDQRMAEITGASAYTIAANFSEWV